MFKITPRIEVGRAVVILLSLLAPCLSHSGFGQALNMDGQSGIFFQPWADVVPSSHHGLGAPTVSFHLVDAGPVAGDYINVGVEEGFGNWLEFGYTRSNHTDGGDPVISPLFNYAGMDIFNVKAKFIPAGSHKLKYVPAVSIGGVLRTNDPYVIQFVEHKNASNGDVYAVATELFTFGKKFAFLANAGVRGTNSQKYGYGGNTLNWQARAFGALGFPIPIEKKIIVAPTIEVDQEPLYIKYVPTAHMPTDLIYAVRVSRFPDSKWTLDIGTGHVGANLAPGINIKVNNAIAVAADFRF